MTTELEQEFFRVFGIEPKKLFSARQGINPDAVIYPEITVEKLLQMICIWNYIVPGIDDCIIPVDYLELKSVVLDTMIRYSEIRYEFDINALKYQIQQLFKD